MSDEGYGSQLSDAPLPTIDVPPMPMAMPVPLPLPPESPGSGASRRRRTAGIIAGAILAVLAVCGLGVLAVSSLSSAFLPGDPFSGGASGILASRWAGDDRYAVVEFQSGGTDGTTSMIAWDSVTLRTRKVDGYRLVATEPSSTQVWLTRAVADDGALDPDTGVEDVMPTDSPWSSADYGGPFTDGPGSIWSWDVAGDAGPQPQSSPLWRPWTSPQGVTAVLSVDPTIGLLPSALTLTQGRGGARSVDLPPGVGTFMPLGWSPSGRFFAVLGNDSENGFPWVVAIIDSKTATIAATYTTDDWPGIVPGSASLDLDGAAWDPVADTVWVSQSSMDDDSGDVAVSVTAVAPGGASFPVVATPSSWKTAMNPSVVLGTSASGMLVEVDTGEGPSVWSVTAAPPRLVALREGDSYTLDAGSYSARSGLIAGVESDQLVGGGANGKALVIDLTGRTLHSIWPAK